ncbi:MAG: hypothetical protein RLZZ126_1553 [Pseudomonadota bacterium]|jgi:amidase
MSLFTYQSATQLAAAIRTRKVGARELLDAQLQRIDRYNPAINAVVCERRDVARARADAADAALARGESWGPLHGLPMTVKESYNLAGLPTHWGLAHFKDNVARQDALAVQRLQAAGAIVFGKTNVPVELADFQSYNPIYGTTENPWMKGRTPGGSSGGSAAALAAGFTPLEMGSDIGGSIRNPAHYCGVFGHKPSYGLVGMQGHSLRDTLTPIDISVCGPLARSAHDLELVLDIVRGPNPWECGGTQVHLPPLAQPINQLRVALWADAPQCRVSQAMQDRVARVGAMLGRAGAQISDSARPAIDVARAHDLFFEMLHAALGSRMPPVMFEQALERLRALPPGDTGEYARLLRAQTVSHHAWVALNEARAALRKAWAVFFEGYDFIITPIMPTSAFAHDHGPFGGRRIDVDGSAQPYFSQTFWAGLAGLVWLPATVVPTGPDAQGLPLGVQIIGPWHGDRQTIQLAQWLEGQPGSDDLCCAFQPPPALA